MPDKSLFEIIIVAINVPIWTVMLVIIKRAMNNRQEIELGIRKLRESIYGLNTKVEVLATEIYHIRDEIGFRATKAFNDVNASFEKIRALEKKMEITKDL